MSIKKYTKVLETYNTLLIVSQTIDIVLEVVENHNMQMYVLFTTYHKYTVVHSCLELLSHFLKTHHQNSNYMQQFYHPYQWK